MHQKAADGTISLCEDGHPYKLPLKAETPEDIKATYNSGGAGCFAVPSEYCSMPLFLSVQSDLKNCTDRKAEIIAALLNGGKCPKTGVQILKPESTKGQ